MSGFLLTAITLTKGVLIGDFLPHADMGDATLISDSSFCTSLVKASFKERVGLLR
jgi:hypothetical protein